MSLGKAGSCLWCGNQMDQTGNICTVCEQIWGGAKGEKKKPQKTENPAAAAPAAEKTASDTPPVVEVPQTRETPLILVIDDEPNITKLLSSRLRAQGYDVQTASNGADGLKIALLEKPDLVIADIMMPKMTGYELLKSLRSQDDEGVRGIPVIIITAKSSMKEFFDNWDIVSFVTKPFKPADLIQTIQKSLAKKAA